MKTRLFLLPILLLAVFATAAAKGKPEITFEKTSHDFGSISNKGGNVICEYEFTNTGDEPLLIISVTNGGCGCTVPSFPKNPILPGEKGKIQITFNPTGRRGELNRTVMVSTNASKKRIKLKFSGVVIPEAK